MTLLLPRSRSQIFNGYRPRVFTLNGATRYQYNSAFSGAAANKLFSGSLWFRPTALPAGNNHRFINGANSGSTAFVGPRVYLDNTTKRFGLAANNSAATAILTIVGSTTTPALNTWYHACWCVDLADTAKRFVYINGVSESFTASIYTNDNIDWTAPTWRIGGRYDATAYYTGDFADLMMWPSYIDFSVAANRAAVYDQGQPVHPRVAAALFGTPLILIGRQEEFGVNAGSGGGTFTFLEGATATEQLTTNPID